jgi:formamidopyrimidine-DNA glycosylase
MPELPDILVLARSMDQALAGQSIADVTVNQPKCLNRTPDEFRAAVVGRTFRRCWQLGKWVLADLDRDWTLAFNLGMGGEIRLHGSEEAADPERERLTFRLGDGRQLWVHFWWFGSVHLVPLGDLGAHRQLGLLGPEPLADDFTPERLGEMLRGRRGAIKKYLLDQSFVAGIGNVYVQDILWHAFLHPLRPANSLDSAAVRQLHQAIQQVLREGIRWGGGPGEQDVWGRKGTYHEHFQVGYRTGKPCPICGTTVEELRVGSTTSYLCPRCQAWPAAGGKATATQPSGDGEAKSVDTTDTGLRG